MNSLIKFTDIKLILKHRFKLYLILCFLLTICSLLEMIAIAALPLYISILIGDTKKFSKFPRLIEILNDFSKYKIVLYGSIILCSIFLIKNVIIFFINKFEHVFISNTNTYLSKLIFENIFKTNYENIKSNNPASYIHILTNTIDGFVLYLKAFLHFFREISIIFLLLILLLITSFQTTIISFSILSFVSILYLLFVKNKLALQGIKSNELAKKQIKVLNQTFGSIKEILLYDKSSNILESYLSDLEKKNRIISNQQLLTTIPRLILEVISMLSISLIVIFFLFQQKSILDLIPILVLFSFSLVRIVPAFNGASIGLTNMRYYSQFKNELFDYLQTNKSKFETKSDSNVINEINTIEFINVSYQYPGSDKYAIKDINFRITNGEKVGFIGNSGSGKSTIIDLILGLIHPTEGEILINGDSIKSVLKSYQSLTSYIPQEIYLLDDSLINNVKFSTNENNIDENRLNRSLINSELNSTGLIDKIHIGNNGNLISGGQKQRISIARALYKNPKLIIIDEGTSALDSFTERKIINNINNYSLNKILIMIAHRFSTLEECDKIYLLKDGQILASGNLIDMINMQKLVN